MQLFQIVVFLTAVVLLQSISLSPLRKVGLPYLLITSMAPAFLLITSGISYYLNSITLFANSYSYVFAFCLALLLEYIFLFLFTKKLSNDRHRIFFNEFKSKMILFEILFVFFVSTLTIIFFTFFYPFAEIVKFGHASDFINVTRDITIHKQEFLQFIYSVAGTNSPAIGLFYPSAGFILGSIASNLLSLAHSSSTIYTLLFTSLFSYPLSIYFLMKILKVPSTQILIVFMIATNAFPMALFFYGYFSFIYGVVGTISLLGLFILISKYLSNSQKLFFIGLFCVIIIPLHPSSVLTFLILLWSYYIIFETSTKQVFFKLVIITSVLVTLILLIMTQFSLLSKNIIALYVAFIDSVPPVYTLDTFLSDGLLIERTLSYAYKNIFALSAWHVSFPIFLIVITVMTYSFFKFNKPLRYFAPLLIYLFLILSASISGIDHPIRFMSVFTVPFYRSPIRIVHLGALIYLLYLARFLADRKQVNYATNL